jgi:hypothetical protein
MVKINDDAKNPLSVVLEAKNFRFCTDFADSCGVGAHSLEEFVDELQYVCSESRVFHFERGDFQNWMRDIVGYNDLAQANDGITKCERHLAAECCRKEIAERANIEFLQLEANGLVNGRIKTLFKKVP